MGLYSWKSHHHAWSNTYTHKQVHYTHSQVCTLLHTHTCLLYTLIPIHFYVHTLQCPPVGPDYNAITNVHPWLLVKTTKEEEALAQGEGPSFSPLLMISTGRPLLPHTNPDQDHAPVLETVVTLFVWEKLLLWDKTLIFISVIFTILSVSHDSHKWIDGFLRSRSNGILQTLVPLWLCEGAAAISPRQESAWLPIPPGRHSFPVSVSSSSSGMKNSKPWSNFEIKSLWKLPGRLDFC